MFSTLLVIIALTLIVALWLGIDLKVSPKGSRWSRKQANLSIHTERMEEIERGKGTDEEKEYQEKTNDAQLLLLDDVGDIPSQTHRSSSLKYVRTFCVILVCGLGLLGYWFWGDPLAPSLVSAVTQLEEVTENDEKLNEDQIRSLIRHLERRERSSKRDQATSTYLILAHSIVDDQASIIKVHERAEQYGYTSEVSDLRRINAELAVHDEITEDAQRVASRVFETAPDHPMVMQAFGIMSIRKGRLLEAKNYLERGFKTVSDTPQAILLSELVKRADELLGEDHNGISVSVKVVSMITPGLWLTVVAQADSQAEPVALIQRPFVQEEVYSFVLDDSATWQDSKPLSTYERIKIVARLTKSNSLNRADIVAEVTTDWIESLEKPISLRLKEMVVPDESIAVRISIDDTFVVDDFDTIFVFGRSIDEAGPPLIVTKIRKSELPVTLNLSKDQAMLPLESLPSDGLIIQARLSRSGNATRAHNDIESEKAMVEIGGIVDLLLNQLVQIESSE